MTLGNNIKLIREAEGLSQEGFGNRIGVSRDAVYTYESRNTSPKQITLNRIVKEFGVPLHELINSELTEETYQHYKKSHATHNSVVNEDEPSYQKENYIQHLYGEISELKSTVESLNISLKTLMENQVVIAAMNQASLDALLTEQAQKKNLKPETYIRNVRNRAISVLKTFRIKGIAAGVDI